VCGLCVRACGRIHKDVEESDRERERENAH